jgi:hypothetical protein
VRRQATAVFYIKISRIKVKNVKKTNHQKQTQIVNFDFVTISSITPNTTSMITKNKASPKVDGTRKAY